MQTIKRKDKRNPRKTWTIKSPCQGYYLANFEIEGQPQKEPARVVSLISVALVLGENINTIKDWFGYGSVAA